MRFHPVLSRALLVVLLLAGCLAAGLLARSLTEPVIACPPPAIMERGFAVPFVVWPLLPAALFP